MNPNQLRTSSFAVIKETTRDREKFGEPVTSNRELSVISLQNVTRLSRRNKKSGELAKIIPIKQGT
jgi:hypothetical protein